MYPNGFAEAGCQKCHGDQVLLPGAEEFNKGRQLYEAAGCWGCHNTVGFEDARNVGPKLEHLVAKTTPEWVARWIRDPKSFKQSTYMPRFWNLENNLDADVGARNDTEVAAIVAYIFDKAVPLSYGVVPAGDVDRGLELVEERGLSRLPHYDRGKSGRSGLVPHAGREPRGHRYQSQPRVSLQLAEGSPTLLGRHLHARPQVDGSGGRGHRRILDDAPERIVRAAFRASDR